MKKLLLVVVLLSTCASVFGATLSEMEALLTSETIRELDQNQREAGLELKSVTEVSEGRFELVYSTASGGVLYQVTAEFASSDKSLVDLRK